jgi:hypothetical protein
MLMRGMPVVNRDAYTTKVEYTDAVVIEAAGAEVGLE